MATTTELNEVFIFDAGLSDQHQISVEVIGTAPVGSELALSGVPKGLTKSVTINDFETDTPILFSITDPDMVFIRGRWESFTITPNTTFTDDLTSTFTVNHNT